MKTKNTEYCPCGLEQNYENCCGRFHNNEEVPTTALELMRSRYSAFVKNLPDYIIQTHDPKSRGEIRRQDIANWAGESEWKGLEILTTKAGEAGDPSGQVEFKAHYESEGRHYVHHEKSDFINQQGQWFYSSGEVYHETIVRSAPKVGRNDPCPCGSGKKYKKCCL